ncbi:MAG: efflux RND transporter permease subunit [Oscillospiraceae bacterium]|nr:efflux RND transporter permease subunit [Oscillospiraceae bacterium]
MIPKFSVKKPLTVFVVALAVVILGVVSYMKMTPDLMPNMDFPYVIVVTSDPGASPESIEQEITRPIEESMATLDHIKTITSTSQNSASMVVLEFEDGTDMNALSLDIQQKLTALEGGWDETVSTPYTMKINPSMLPVMVAAISYEGMEVEELSDLVNEELEQKLTGISGVASVDISGTLARQMHVVLDGEKLDKVSAEMLVEAEKLLDDAEKTLKDAREQVVEAQEKIADAKEDMADEAAGEISGAASSAGDMLDEVQKFDPDNFDEDALPEFDTPEFEELSKEEQIQVLVAQGNAYETSIATNKQTITNYNQTIEANNETIKAHQDTIAANEAAIALNDAEIASLELKKNTFGLSTEESDRLAALYDENTVLTSQNEDLSYAITELRTQNAQMRLEIPVLEQQNVSSENAMAEIDNILVTEYDTTRESENKKNEEEAEKEAEKNEKEAEDALKELDKLLDQLSDKNAVSDMMVGAMDGMQQLTEAEIRLNDALMQIDQGLATVESERKNLKDTLDVGGMLSVPMVEQLLTAQNFSMPAGYIDDNEGISYMVSVGDSLSTREEVEALVIFDPGLGDMTPIRLEDIATVVYTDNGDEIYAKLNGVNGIIATFTKQSTYATAEVSDNITRRLAQLSEEYDGLDFHPLMDQGDYIYLIVETILSSLMWGALFSVLVLFLFLRDWRPTLITLISIPTSVIFAIVLMYFSGVTINMISLSGLAVSVGMLVDNSVVVIENIYRLRDKGATVIQAAVSGAQQVAGAVVSSTLTTVCVFLPIVFVEGFTKDLFTDLALTMTYSLMASLLVALTVVPAMGCGMLRRIPEKKAGLLDKVMPAYRKAITWSLEHKALVLLASLVLLLSSAAAILGRGFTFMPEMDMNSVNVSVTLPDDCTREEAEALTDEVSRRIQTIEEVTAVGATLDGGGAAAMLSGGGYSATVYVTMPDNISGNEVGRQINALCADMECEVSATNVMDGMMSMMTGSGVSIQVFGDDMEHLQTAAKSIAAAMEKVEGIASASDGLEEAAPALHVSVDRTKAMQHGMTVAQIYMEIASALSTASTAQDITLDNQDFSLTIEADESSVLTRETLLTLKIDPDTSVAAMSGMGGGMSSMGSMGGMSSMSGMGGSMDMGNMDMDAFEEMLGGESDDKDADGEKKDDEKKEEKKEEPAVEEDNSFLLGDVATIEETVSLNTISHDQQRRHLTVTGLIAEGYNVTLVSSDVEKAVKALTLPEDVTVEFAGENETIMEAMGQLGLMLVLGIVLVYFIMVAQFQSLREPFIVMFTIPLAFTGGFAALLIAGMEVSIISLIGFVMLVGIIVNNGIVLVDYINQQRMAGMERREAIIDAGCTRLRPILMTSLTTILGMIVTATAQNAGTSLMRPVALVCIGGLLYATLMTLLVVPCMYEIISKKTIRIVDEAELELLED